QFPYYLLPPLPFISRLLPSSSSASSCSSSAPRGHAQTLQCRLCQTHLAPTTHIISKGFMGRHGRAYLLNALTTPHITYSPPTPRPLVTGMHTVSDVSCSLCGTVLGWKYLAAEDRAQKYKVGKMILERSRVEKVNCWDGVEVLEGKGEGEEEGGMEVEVDSADEDELEDLFLGVWTKEGALKKRKAKREK
ncbi:yippee zinc-binding/DNA-binding /Mis18, centromere assembly-domain-containing protein, partial [Tuber borchii]